jgi:hypothetical protein
MIDPPNYWLSIDAAFTGPSGVAVWAAINGAASLLGSFAFSAALDGMRHCIEQVSAMKYGKLPTGGAGAPSLFVIEYPYLDKGVSTAIKLGRAVGRFEALAEWLDARTELLTAAKWRKLVGIKARSGDAAKARCRSLVRALAVHPEERPRFKGQLDRVWLPAAKGVGLSKADTDRAEAIGCGLGYALDQGWALSTG